MQDDDLDTLLSNDENDDDSDETPQIRQLREALKRAKRELKELRPIKEEVEGLRSKVAEFEGQTRVQQAEQAFKDAELPKGFARFFAKEHEGEITKEAALSWAQANEIVAPAESSEPTERPLSLAPTVGGETPGQKVWTRKELDEAVKNGQVSHSKARDLIASGRVQFSNPQAAQRLAEARSG